MCSSLSVYECACMLETKEEVENVRARANDILWRIGWSLCVIHHSETAEGQNHQSASSSTQHTADTDVRWKESTPGD